MRARAEVFSRLDFFLPPLTPFSLSLPWSSSPMSQEKADPARKKPAVERNQCNPRCQREGNVQNQSVVSPQSRQSGKWAYLGVSKSNRKGCKAYPSQRLSAFLSRARACTLAEGLEASADHLHPKGDICLGSGAANFHVRLCNTRDPTPEI